MTASNRLTLKKIAKLGPGVSGETGKPIPARYLDGHGLYLQVAPGGSKSWLFRFERKKQPDGKEEVKPDGKVKMKRIDEWVGLGPLHTVSLAEARERARQCRQQILDGTDPQLSKRQARAALILQAASTVTFEAAAQQYFEHRQASWKNAKHRAQFLASLRLYAFDKIGKLAVADVDQKAVLRVLDPIWPTKTETASRVRGRIESVLDWAKVRGYRQGDNPARWSENLEHALPARSQLQKVEHHAALPFNELPDFMAALREREGVSARALEFTILCASRTGETIDATWDEIDLKQKVWTISAARMKAGKEHIVPLSTRAVEILKEQDKRRDRNCDAVFVSDRGSHLSNMAMAMVLKRMNRNDITVHGFRSTFRDWAGDRTNFPRDVVEFALAHVVKDKSEAAYRRNTALPKRRLLMEAWAKYATMPASTGKVIPMRKASRA